MDTKIIRERSSTPAAKRMRRSRQRRREGEFLVRLRLFKTDVDALIKRRYLFEENRDDRAYVEGAADAFFGDKLFEGVSRKIIPNV
jgi:hypothetical protein